MGHDYTGNHIAVFECKMKVPNQVLLIDHTLKEYVMQHRINFANWCIADMDNFMKGNSFFTKYESEEMFQKELDRIIGSRENLHVPLP